MSIFRNLNAKCDGQTERRTDRRTVRSLYALLRGHKKCASTVNQTAIHFIDILSKFSVYLDASTTTYRLQRLTSQVAPTKQATQTTSISVPYSVNRSTQSGNARAIDFSFLREQ
ncbi:hypothetical protein DPMN_032738 [Dreissena polymorpha]|uniref:Uncharacterized protein n=1 Tax=Dreissena polymorpha TaxID=45954 RepID=A0A9D4M4I2_DREPO|nr:hypothetical protein DPMN_032738 [Dreissena polymorpha]